jgi:PAS domain S-box-containing protein
VNPPSDPRATSFSAGSGVVASGSGLRRLLESLDVIVWEADAATFRLTYVSSAVERLLGYTPADWLAQGFRERTVHPDDRHWVTSRWSRLRLGSDEDQFEYRVLDANGRWVWLRESVRVFTPSPDLSGVVQGVLVDVTREKLAERRLQEQLDLTEAVFDGLEVFAVLVDAAGRVARVNRACESALGPFSPAATGRPFTDVFVPPVHREAVEAAIASTLAGRGRSRVEAACARDSGAERWVAWTFVPVRDAEDRTLVVASGVDISERRQIARELRLHEETLVRGTGLEPYARRVERLAHDFNNALTGLLGFCELLAPSLQGEQGSQHLEEIRAAAERVAGLTAELRALGAEGVAAPGSAGDAGAPAVPTVRGAPPLHPAERVVLLAEDEGIVRRLMVQTLRREGWEVLDAPSGAEALRLARERGLSLDLLVTDIMMPGMSGRELAERLRRTQPDLPVLFVTGFSSEDDPRRLPGSGVALLQKPFLPESLVARVRELLPARTG